MSLKERLEAVWNRGEIACPSHLVQWNEKGAGYSRFSDNGLFFKHGRLTKLKKLRKLPFDLSPVPSDTRVKITHQ